MLTRLQSEDVNRTSVLGLSTTIWQGWVIRSEVKAKNQKFLANIE